MMAADSEVIEYPYEDHALEAISKMWWRLGEEYESKAFVKVEHDLDTTSLRYAEMAEAAYWRATGNVETIDISGGHIRVFKRVEEMTTEATKGKDA